MDTIKSKNRRSFIKNSIATTGLFASTYLLSSNKSQASTSKSQHLAAHVKPGEMDEYYGFWSGGHSGEIRILGVPSMRELKRIPVFNYDCTFGWGITNYSKKLLNNYTIGDTHHVHLSYNNGTYDGNYAFVNDKSSGRLARIRLDHMETDAITKIPNAQGTHGIFPSRNKLDSVYCNSEFRIPIPNDGTNANNPKKYVALHTCVDAKTMKVKWQIMVDGNLDLCATDYQGKYSMGTCYNSEEGVTLQEMMSADRDHLTVFNLERIESAIKVGKGKKLNGSNTPILDGRGTNPYVLYIPIPKNPHGVNIDPTGKYAICCGKLSPTVSIIPIEKIDDAFAGKITDPRDCVVAEPKIGLGPLHTAFDNKGNAYTSLFVDSIVAKWNIQKAISNEPCIIQKLDVHYQVGHINASMSETKDADGKFLVALNKFSKGRFLPVGPFFPENDQLISIKDKMEIIHDGSASPEPHDAVIVTRDLINPKQIWNKKDRKFSWEMNLAKELNVELGSDKVIKQNNKVFVIMSSVAPNYGINTIQAKLGDEITIVQTNLDTFEDLCHGFCLSEYNINFGVSPSETVSVTFTANKAGVFWYYCPWFCHALHLEMRGRLIIS